MKKHNIFDYYCLHKIPGKSEFDRIFAFSLLYKSELGDLDETTADNTTAMLVCGKCPEEILKALNESGYSIVKCGNGIYRVNIYTLIDMYMLVMSELGKAEYSWMESILRQAGGECQEILINGMKCNFRIAEF